MALRTRQATQRPKFTTPESIQALIRASKDTRWQVQVAAIMELSHIKAPGVHKALVAALANPHQYVQIAAAKALAIRKDPSAVPALLKALDDPIVNVQTAAAEALRKFNDPRPIQKLLPRLNHKDPYVRQKTARVLGILGNPIAIRPLIQLLKDQTSYVWQTAAKALLKLDPGKVVPALFAALKSPDRLLQTRAKKMINRIHDPRAVRQFLKVFLTSRSTEARALAAAAMGRIKDRQVVPGLIASLKVKPWHDKILAMKTLAKIGDRRAVPEIIKCLGDGSLSVREAAIKALIVLRDPRAVLPLMNVAKKDSSSSIRGEAVKALAKLGGSRARKAIIHVLRSDHEWSNRMLAADALGVLKGPDAVQALIKALDDDKNTDEKFVREAIAMALGKNKDPRAEPKLITLLNDKSPKVRMAAIRALIEIAGPKARQALKAVLKNPSRAKEVVKVLKSLRRTPAPSEKMDFRMLEGRASIAGDDTGGKFIMSGIRSGAAPGWGSPLAITKTMRTARKAVDYKLMFGQARVICIGDQHTSDVREEKELMAHMARFKQLGITHIALEMVSSNLQRLLNHYFKRGGKIPAPIVRHIQKRNTNRKIIAGYLGLIRAARRAGIRIVGIEHPKASGLIVARYAAMKTHTRYYALKIRNPHWAKHIRRVLDSNPRSKIIVFGGKVHFGYPSAVDDRTGWPVNLLLKRSGFKVRVIDPVNYDVNLIAKKLGLSRKRFMLRGARRPTPSADWLMHVP